MRLKKLRTCATIMSREFFHSTLPTPWQMVPEKSDINAHMGSCFAPFFSNILPPSDHYLTLNTSCRHLDLLLTRFIRRALKLFVWHLILDHLGQINILRNFQSNWMITFWENWMQVSTVCLQKQAIIKPFSFCIWFW